MKEIENTEKSIRENRIKQNQNIIDYSESKTAKYEAQLANATKYSTKSKLFKNKELVFGGRSYDFEVVGKLPNKGDIIRMLSENGSKAVCNGTRVKVIDVKSSSNNSRQRISCVASSMSEPSLSSK